MQQLNAKIQPSHSRGNLVQSPDLPLIQQGENFLYDARLLYKDLRIKVKFEDWIRRRIADFKFENGVDFFANLRKSTGGRPATEYLLTIDMCKELGMLERSEIGRIIRKGFIEAEKKARGISQLPREASIFKGLKCEKINGRRLYPYREMLGRIGYNNSAGSCSSRVHRYPGHFVKMGHVQLISEEFALHLYHQRQVYNNRQVMKQMQPVLPFNFGEPLPLTKNTGGKL